MCGGRCRCGGICALRGHQAEAVWIDEPTVDCDPATVPQGNSETALRLGIGEGR